MNKIVDFALSKGKTTLTIALLVLIAGSYSRTIIPVAADPSIQLPLVSVSVFLDGASPNDASRLIAKPLENRLRSVPGIEEISSSILEDISSIPGTLLSLFSKGFAINLDASFGEAPSRKTETLTRGS